jgi:hypothetical protein
MNFVICYVIDWSGSPFIRKRPELRAGKMNECTRQFICRVGRQKKSEFRSIRMDEGQDDAAVLAPLGVANLGHGKYVDRSFLHICSSGALPTWGHQVPARDHSRAGIDILPTSDEPGGVLMDAAAALRLTFTDPFDFTAAHRAVALLENAGFSVGRMQAGAPRGILFGNYDIQKWKNLSADHRQALHGVMTGDMRNGPVTVEIFDSAPDEAKTAMRRLEVVL